MKNHALGVFLFGLATVISMTLLYGIDLGRGWIEVSGSTAKEYEVPIRKVQTAELRTALTFNASEDNDRSGELLELLDERGTKASFFVTAAWAESHPEELRGMADGGHDLGLLEHGEETEEELLASRKELEELSGEEIRLFRPEEDPCGRETVRRAGACGLQTIGWSVDSLDWKEYGAEAVIRQISENLESGSIILCRTDAEDTREALEGLLELFGIQGYEAVTAAELLSGGQGYAERDGTWVPEQTA